MDDAAIILLRFGGYVLNIFLFLVIILRYRHHVVLFGWVFFLVLSAMITLLRFAGRMESYFALLDYGLTPVLYFNAFMTVWILVKYRGAPPNKE